MMIKTVGELKAFLADMPDNMPVFVWEDTIRLSYPICPTVTRNALMLWPGDPEQNCSIYTLKGD